MSEEMEFGPDILTLSDEEGNEHEFEVIDTLEIGAEKYMALVPVIESEDDDSGELVVMKIGTEDDEEFLETISDEEEFGRVSEMFMKRLEEDFEFTE